MTTILLHTIQQSKQMRNDFLNAATRFDLMEVYAQAHITLERKYDGFTCSFNSFLKAIGE